MLDKTQMNGRYRDPYLAALAWQAGADAGLPEVAGGPVLTGGHVEDLPMDGASRVAAPRCAAPAMDGFCGRPDREEFLERFDNVCAEFGVDEQLKLAVPQRVRDGRGGSTSRPRPAEAGLLGALAAAGL